MRPLTPHPRLPSAPGSSSNSDLGCRTRKLLAADYWTRLLDKSLAAIGDVRFGTVALALFDRLSPLLNFEERRTGTTHSKFVHTTRAPLCMVVCLVRL